MSTFVDINKYQSKIEFKSKAQIKYVKSYCLCKYDKIDYATLEMDCELQLHPVKNL